VTNGTTTTHIWDGANIAAELTGSTVSATYVRGINLIAKGGGTQYYSFNAHGDVVQLTNSSGTVTKDYRYDAFGVEVDPQGTDTNPWRYCGEYWDREINIYYLQARNYNPTTGRFSTEDTYRGDSSDPLSLNLYTYCGNDPVNNVDPTGHISEKAADKLIEDNAQFIIEAAEKVGIDPAILAACIYTEQRNNVGFTENLEDWFQMMLGMDCSVGIAQVRISTAKKIEDAGYVEKTGKLTRYSTMYVFGMKRTEKAIFTREERIYYKLKDNKIGIRYAASYLALIQDMWQDKYPKINIDTAVLATLYNIGESGGERGINSSPESTEFGDYAAKYYDHLKSLLKL
jgi:RHS repeat-associated protein